MLLNHSSIKSNEESFEKAQLNMHTSQDQNPMKTEFKIVHSSKQLIKGPYYLDSPGKLTDSGNIHNKRYSRINITTNEVSFRIEREVIANVVGKLLLNLSQISENKYQSSTIDTNGSQSNILNLISCLKSLRAQFKDTFLIKLTFEEVESIYVSVNKNLFQELIELLFPVLHSRIQYEII